MSERSEPLIADAATAPLTPSPERDQLLAALEHERAKLAAIVEQAPAFICTLHGPDHVFELVNERYYEIVGRRELIGRPLAEALPEVEGQGYREILDRVYRTGEPFSGYEMPALLRRGPGDALESRFINVAWQALRDADGAINGVFVHGVDVTDAVLARDAARASEARLRTSEERLAFSIEAAELGTFYCPMPFAHIEWNAKCKEHFWLAADADVDIDLFYALLHPDDRAPTGLAIERSLERREAYDVEYRTLAPDGRVRWVHARGRAYYGPDGQPTRFDGVTLDVTAQKRAEAELLAGESRFRELADSMPQIVWAARPDGTLDYYNRRWFAFVSLPVDADRAAVDWGQYVHPDDLAPVGVAWARSLASGDAYQMEFRVRGATGAYGWFLVRAEPIRGADNAIVRWYGTCADIEDRKLAEARDQFLLLLDEASRPLTDPAEITATHARLLGEHLAADRCAYADVEADQDTFNLTGDYTRGVPSIVGRYRFADFGQTCLNLMRAGEPYVVEDVDALGLPPDIRAAYRATMIQSVVCVPLHKGGHFVAAMAVHARTPRRWSDDEVRLVQRVAARCWESIERARVERSLRVSERRFRDMADTAPAILWVTEADGTCSFLSRGWYELTGQTEETGLGYGWVDAAHPDDRPAARDAFLAATAEQRPYEVDFRLRRADGAYRWVIDAGRPRFDADGRLLGFIGSVIDITDRKRAEEERKTLFESERSARLEADRASRMKDEFLATLSHELRTPLSAILGWAQVLRRAPATPDVLAQGLDTIERNARAQTQIIEDLLDMSRIISGKVSLNSGRTDLTAIVRAAIDTVSAAANAKTIVLHFEAAPNARHPVLGDANRLQQVFWNLLSNAIKFTPRGGVVQVRIEQRHSQWQVDVVDSGEGITEAFLPYVFERFRQQDGSTTRRHGGLGLGLAIVKQLVELHGGTVRVKSDGPGKGATFTVSLPVSVVHSEPATAGPRGSEALTSDARTSASPSASGDGPSWDASACEDLAGMTVLVVDDEPDARALLLRLLTDCNARVVTAANAEEAFALLQRERPDILVSDIGMPGEDGYSLVRRIRALDANAGGTTPAIALTAYARAEDRVKAIRAGFQTHVPKPVEPSELLTMVAMLAKRSER